MKTIFYSLLMMLLFIACNKEDTMEKELTDEELLTIAFDQIVEHDSFFDVLFEEVSSVANEDTVMNILVQSHSKHEFFTSMEALTGSIFSSIFELNKSQFDLNNAPEGLTGEAETMLKNTLIDAGESLPPPYFTPSSASDNVIMYTGLEFMVDEQQADDPHKEWIILDGLNHMGTSHDVPAEDVKFNFTTIRRLLKLLPVIESDQTPTGETKPFIDSLKQWGLSETTIGLLLPAVQKVREAASSSSDADYLQWVDDMILENQPANAEALKNRLDAATLYGSLLFLLSTEYSPDQLDKVYLSFLHTRYKIIMYFVWDEIWRSNLPSPQ